MVSKAGKLLLKNTIQSLEHQNKIKEEKEMWNKWQNERSNERPNERHYKRKDRDYRQYDEDVKPSDQKRHKINDGKTDNYWLKKLMAEEEKLSNERWTHNGFKELYSEEFKSKSSSSDSSEEEVPKKKSKKKKKKSKTHKKHKNKKHKKKRKD